MNVKTFVKKPVEIQALQFTGYNHNEVSAFIGYSTDDGSASWEEVEFFDIYTLEGVMTASPGDWIIRGVQGEYYPCKPDIFEQTYEEVN